MFPAEAKMALTELRAQNGQCKAEFWLIELDRWGYLLLKTPWTDTFGTFWRLLECFISATKIFKEHLVPTHPSVGSGDDLLEGCLKTRYRFLQIFAPLRCAIPSIAIKEDQRKVRSTRRVGFPVKFFCSHFFLSVFWQLWSVVWWFESGFSMTLTCRSMVLESFEVIFDACFLRFLGFLTVFWCLKLSNILAPWQVLTSAHGQLIGLQTLDGWTWSEEDLVSESRQNAWVLGLLSGWLFIFNLTYRLL